MKATPNEQLKFEFKTHGGKRKNAGRKPAAKDRVKHETRAKVSKHTPFSITLHLVDGLTGLRCAAFMEKLTRAITLAKRKGLRVIHFSVQSNHLHFVCEAASGKQIELGMRSLSTSLAKATQNVLGIVECG